MNDIEQIFAETLDGRMSAEAIAEANDKTIPGGTYRFDITKKEIETAGEQSPWPGRLIVRVQADAMAKQEDGSYTRRGKVFFDVSPVEMKNAKTGRIDPATKLWGNLLGIVGPTATNREAYEYLGNYPLRGSVSRTFKTVDGKWVTPKTKDEENALVKEGGEPRNFVQSIGAFNG